MEIVEKIKAEMAAFDEKRKELTEQLKKDFPALLAPLFEKYPSVKNVRWTQYTPYFNDGDPCEFSTNASWADLNYNNNEDEDDEDDDDTEKVEAEEIEVPEEAEDEFREVLSSIDDSFYKDLFGDHVEVTVLRDGTINIEEYEHD
jgi:TRAP-type C4-dicarboxylate transport system substrate-binding protein